MFAETLHPYVVNARRIAGALVLAVGPWLALLAVALALSGCIQSPASRPALARLPARSSAALNGNGPTSTGTATFDAVTVDPNSWQGSPLGTGDFQIPLNPPLSGGPGSIAAVQPSDGGPTWYYVIVADFSAQAGTGLVIASDLPFTPGTSAISSDFYVGAFDLATGNALATAQSGTLTLTVANTQLGGHVTGTLSADFQAVTSPPPPAQCRTNADCPAGEACQNGSCVPQTNPGCTTNAQCPSGEVCVNGGCEPGQSGNCLQQRGTGSFQVSEPAVSSCSALGAPSANASQATAFGGSIDPSGQTPAIILLDANNQQVGIALQLTACPTQAGTLTIGSGVDAYFFSPVANAGPHVQVSGQYQASGGSVTFTQVGATLAGSASLTFDNGGTGSASFTLQ